MPQPTRHEGSHMPVKKFFRTVKPSLDNLSTTSALFIPFEMIGTHLITELMGEYEVVVSTHAVVLHVPGDTFGFGSALILRVPSGLTVTVADFPTHLKLPGFAGSGAAATQSSELGSVGLAATFVVAAVFAVAIAIPHLFKISSSTFALASASAFAVASASAFALASGGGAVAVAAGVAAGAGSR